MKLLDLFSGIGGFSLGLHRAGFNTIAFCEIDSDARLVLSKNFPDIPLFSDIRNLSGKQVGSVDSICGGFPCQDVSVAGKGEGLAGARSGLWTHYLRLIQELEPTYAIIENVPNLRGKGLSTVLKDLWEVGYDAEWHIIPASSVGASHARERLWIIAYPTSLSIQEPLIEWRESFASKQEKPRFGNGWVSEWFTHWIRSSLVPEGNAVSRQGASAALKQYGNAVVPDIPEIIGRQLLTHFNSLHSDNSL